MNSRVFLRLAGAVFLTVVAASCAKEEPSAVVQAPEWVEPRPEIYADFELTADLSHLTDNQREMIGLLIDASEIMDDLFWRQSYGDD